VALERRDVGLDFGVVVEGGFAVAPGVANLHILVEGVLGNCHGAGFLSSPNTAWRAILRFLREKL
jgi:hypothetical protein